MLYKYHKKYVNVVFYINFNLIIYKNYYLKPVQRVTANEFKIIKVDTTIKAHLIIKYENQTFN